MNKKFELSMLAKAFMLTWGIGVAPTLSQAAMVGSQSGSEITLEDGTTLIGDASYSGGLYGILVPVTTTGTVDAGTGSTVSVTDAEHYAQGIVIRGPDSTFIADKLKLNVSGKSATGIDLLGKNGSASLGSGTSVTVAGTGTGSAYGITVGYGSSLETDTLNVSTQGYRGTGIHVTGYGSSADIGEDSVIETNGYNSHGVQVDALTGVEADGVPSFNAGSLTITTLGDGSNAVNIQADSTANLGSHSTLITRGNTSSGILSMGELTADHVTISTSGTMSMGIEARDVSTVTIGAGSEVASTQSGSLVAMGDSATINFLGSEDERNTLRSSGSYGASAQSTGATVNLQNTDISIKTAGGAGIWALLGGVVNGDGLTITGSSEAAGVLALASGQVNLTNDLTIDMGAPEGTAIATRYNEGYAPGVVTADGKMAITGSVISNGGMIDLNFAAGSLWSGSASSDNIDDGHLNVSLTSSEWQVASSSNVDNLQLSNALVDLSAATDSSAYSTLTIANLSGSGDFTLRTDIVGDGDGVNNTGDKIVVTGSSAGDYGLTILNQGSAITTGNEVLTVVETTDGVATFRGNSDVELGGYVYTVNKQGTNWVLSSPKVDDNSGEAVQPDNSDSGATPDNGTPDNGTVVVPSDETPVTPEDNEKAVTPTPTPTEPTKPAITTTANAGANFLNIGYLMNYAETQTLLQRMGDVRQGKTSGNVWLRGVNGRFSGFAGGKLSDFKMNYSGYQFGVDKRLAENVPVYLGLFMGVTEASPHYQSGDGTTKSAHFGAYTTWVNDAGFYVDGVVKINRLRNQFSVNDTQGNRVSGNAVSSGISASLEAGKKFSFSDGTAGFYLEPQIQMTAGRQAGSRIQATNGLTIDLSSYKSLQGRASVLAGYEINQRDYKLNTYVKTGVLREYGGDTNYALNGSRESLTFQGNGWNNGVGVSAQMKNHTLFLEADLTDGDRFNQRQVNAGYRFSF